MQTSSRQTYLDWLRIIAIIGVLFFHSAMPYVAYWEWHIKNPETSHVLLEMNDFLHRFRMPLLFFISGTVSYYMLQHRTGGGFLGLRFRRLFIPLLLGILVIVPPQVYLERLTQGYKGNFWQFYGEMFTTGVYPKGNMSWHHLWFICYLLVYDIVCAPFFVWLGKPGGQRFLQRFAVLAKGARVYLLMLPSIVLYASLVFKYRFTGNLVQDYLYAPYYLLFLLAGFLCIACPVLMDSLERNRRLSLAIGFVSLVFIDYLRWNHLDAIHFLPGFPMGVRYLAVAIHALCAWMWVFTAIGYGKKYLNKPSRMLGYVNEAVYPFYILHQTVIVILTYYLVQVSDGIGMKYLFTVVVTFFISMTIFHLFIRPYAFMRLLFGMKPLPRKKTIEEDAVVVNTPPVLTIGA